MLKAEQDYHLRAAAYSEEDGLRAEHRGVVRWIDEVLSGMMQARYAWQAKERLGAASATEREPADGSPWMEGDGLPVEEER